MDGSVLWVGEWVSVVGRCAEIWCVWFVGGHFGGWGWLVLWVGGCSRGGSENFQFRLKGLPLQKKVGMIKEGV